MKKIFFAAIAATALLTACNKPGATNVKLNSDIDSLSYALGLQQQANDEQIKQMLVQMGSDSIYVEEFFKGFKDGLKAGDNKKEMAYMMGQQSGMSTKLRMFAEVEHSVFAGDSTKHVSVTNFMMGLNDSRRGRVAFHDKNGKVMDQAEMNVMLKGLVDRMSSAASEKMYGDKKKASEQYMAKVAKEAGVKPLKDGIYYKEIKPGDGKKPTLEQMIEVEYEGRLVDGTVFDSTKNHGEATSKMPLGQMIPGWQKALVEMPAGSEWELYIPYTEGYGVKESGPIPPYSTLIFKIKLVSVSDAPAQAAPQMAPQQIQVQ